MDEESDSQTVEREVIKQEFVTWFGIVTELGKAYTEDEDDQCAKEYSAMRDLLEDSDTKFASEEVNVSLLRYDPTKDADSVASPEELWINVDVLPADIYRPQFISESHGIIVTCLEIFLSNKGNGVERLRPGDDSVEPGKYSTDPHAILKPGVTRESLGTLVQAETAPRALEPISGQSLERLKFLARGIGTGLFREST